MYFRLKHILPLLFIFLVVTSHKEHSSFEKGLAFYNNRAEGCKGAEANQNIINQALSNFEKAYLEKPNALVAEYLVRSYYFKGNFTVPNKMDRQLVFEKGKNFGEKAIAKYPNSAELLYYHTITYGKWGEHIGLWSGLKEDVADKLKENFERVIELNPKAVEAGGHRILGVLHYQIPYVPFVVSWPSSDEAEKNLKAALKYFPNNPSNNFFYAEFLFKEDRYDESKVYLNKIISMKQREDFFVEDSWAIIEAKKILNKIES